jgi:hypothetical protein
MAWFNDYSRDYDRAAGYDRGRNPRDTPGWRSSNYGYDRGWNTRGTARGDNRGGYWGENSTRPGYGRDYLGRERGYDTEYDFSYRQRHPENSPFYGREADQEVQRWARRYGYDMQFQIDPRQGGRGQQQGGYGGASGRQQWGGRGRSGGSAGGAGSRGMNRGNRF